jgi:hypothetical protein
MELSYDKIRKLFEPWMEDQRHIHDWCSEYGEPGYSTRHDAETPSIWLGDWWCHCHEPFPGRTEKQANDPRPLHRISDHYPRLFRQLEAQGVEFEWYDEWMIDWEGGGKCYRTSGDSYSWMPSAIYDDGGDILSPDSDIEDWIEYVANDPHKCLLSRVHSAGDIEAVGFESYNGRYESGWHPGQDDDPDKITQKIRRETGLDEDELTIVFVITGNGQFDTEFKAYTRLVKEDVDA